MPTGRPEVSRGALRGARATVLAVTAVALAAAAHLAGGGSLPSVPVLLVLAVPLTWAAVAATSRVQGRWSLIAALAGTQLVLHEAFMALAGSSCALPTSATGWPAMHGSGAMTASMGSELARCVPQAGMTGMDAAVPAGLGGTAMFVAHAVATVLTGLVLARGERALVVLVTVLGAPQRRLAATRLVVPALVSGPVSRPGWSGVPALISAVFDAAGGRRGPPRVLRLPAIV